MVGERISRTDETDQPLGRVARSTTLAWARQHVQQGGRLWLFLDYDGTLVPIAPTPDQARPTPSLRNLLTHLAQIPVFRVVILSGRPLASLQAMLPETGLTLAGLYGLAIQWPDATTTLRFKSAQLRPLVERVLADWAAVIGRRPGFFVEDKGAAVTLHADFAGSEDAEIVLPLARRAAEQRAHGNDFRVLSGQRFLDFIPIQAHKGKSVAWFLNGGIFPDALPIYFGDDENDEAAFPVIQQRNGQTIGVGSSRLASANEYLSSPAEVQAWLELLTRSTSL